jgi:hypothetical protein
MVNSPWIGSPLTLTRLHTWYLQNPEHRGPGAPSLGTDPSYSEPQRKKFKGASWTDADPSLLSTTAAELLLIGTRDEPSGECAGVCLSSSVPRLQSSMVCKVPQCSAYGQRASFATCCTVSPGHVRL